MIKINHDSSEHEIYDPRLDLSGYRFPDISLLKKYENTDSQVDMEEQNENKDRIRKRVQCAFVNTDEIKRIVSAIGNQTGFETAYPLPEVFDDIY
jgi:S-DNA-T family DNA segregation ATPase FtsK/SpoIIIE